LDVAAARAAVTPAAYGRLFLVLEAAPQQSGGNGFTLLILMVLFIGVFYFLMIRPNAKKRREAQQMQSTLGPGSEVVTIGGLHGTVVGVEDDVVSLEIAPGVVVRFVRAAIGQVKTPGAAAAEDAAGETGTDEAAGDAVAGEPVVAEPVESPVVETRKKD
jgi:preprotein translocase subunit YajC